MRHVLHNSYSQQGGQHDRSSIMNDKDNDNNNDSMAETRGIEDHTPPSHLSLSLSRLFGLGMAAGACPAVPTGHFYP